MMMVMHPQTKPNTDITSKRDVYMLDTSVERYKGIELSCSSEVNKYDRLYFCKTIKLERAI